MEKESLTKLAAAAIKQLQSENKTLRETIDKNDEVIKLAFDMYHSGIIAAEELEVKIKEFNKKTSEELEIIKKASEFNKTASSLNSFKLSSGNSFDKTNPEDRFISFLIEDL